MYIRELPEAIDCPTCGKAGMAILTFFDVSAKYNCVSCSNTTARGFTHSDITSASEKKYFDENGVEYTPPDDDALKAVKVGIIEADFNDFIAAHYSDNIRDAMAMLYAKAENEGKTNRAAYVKPALDWVEDALEEFSNKVVAIMSAADTTAINAVTWDFATWETTTNDPAISLPSALVITD
jgi:hypothetical protein